MCVYSPVFVSVVKFALLRHLHLSGGLLGCDTNLISSNNTAHLAVFAELRTHCLEGRTILNQASTFALQHCGSRERIASSPTCICQLLRTNRVL